MVSDIEAYLFAKFDAPRLGITDKPLLCQIMHHITGIPFQIQDFNAFLLQAPSTKQLIHGFHARGVKSEEIERILGLKQSNVSYHVHHPPKGQYMNRYLAEERFRIHAGSDFYY